MPNIDWSTIEGFNEEMTAEERLQLFINSPAQEDPELVTARSRIAELQADIAKRMTDDERKAAAQAEIMEELKTLRRKDAISGHKMSFMAQGYGEELATKAATAMHDGNHAELFKIMQKFQEDTVKQAKEQALAGTPRPPISDSKNEPESDAIKVAKRLAAAATARNQSARDALARYT